MKLSFESSKTTGHFSLGKKVLKLNSEYCKVKYSIEESIQPPKLLLILR